MSSKLEEEAGIYLHGVCDGIGYDRQKNDLDRGQVEEAIIAQLMEGREEVYQMKLKALHMFSIDGWKP